jgi:hypothetical protein
MKGRLFSSFEETWADFLARSEPLEDFFAALPEGEEFLTVWHAPPGPAAIAEVAVVQRALDGLEGLRLTPPHWLHVSLGLGREDDLERVRDRLRGAVAYEAEYGPATCFHEAVVLEVRGETFAELARAVEPDRDLAFFLPHVSIAYTDGTPSPGPIRDRLLPLRDRPPVRERVREIQLCVVPIARDALLSPWRTLGAVSLGDTTSV